MAGLRLLARPMLASIFVIQGLETWQHPEKVSGVAGPVVSRLAEQLPAVPTDPEQAVRINGAVQVTAGTLLALGILPRLSAIALAGTLVPTTLAGHRFWDYEDPQARAQQRIQFLKNLTMLGGLLIAAADSGEELSDHAETAASGSAEKGPRQGRALPARCDSALCVGMPNPTDGPAFGRALHEEEATQ